MTNWPARAAQMISWPVPAARYVEQQGNDELARLGPRAMWSSKAKIAGPPGRRVHAPLRVRSALV